MLVKERKNEKKKWYLHHVINIAAPVQSSGEKLVVDPFNLKFLVVCNGLDCPPRWQFCAAESADPLESGWIVVPLQLTLAFLPLYLYLSLCLYPFIFGFLFLPYLPKQTAALQSRGLLGVSSQWGVFPGLCRFMLALDGSVEFDTPLDVMYGLIIKSWLID